MGSSETSRGGLEGGSRNGMKGFLGFASATTVGFGIGMVSLDTKFELLKLSLWLVVRA